MTIYDKAFFYVTVQNGLIPRHVSEKIRDLFRRNEGRMLTISVERYRRQRSNNQNRYYWGCVVPHIIRMFEEAGSIVTPDEVHDFLRHELKLIRHVTDPAGEVHSIIRSSSDLDTREWEDWMERIRVWAAERGTQIPLPNEV
jgi:hypothetical protein